MRDFPSYDRRSVTRGGGDAVENFDPQPRAPEDATDPTIGLGWSLRSDADGRAPAYKGLLELSYAKRPTRP